ncbi:heme ABC transporter permease CcmC [Hellea sp.]|nr:heme ABC transporter permease CcmC [Hellea sp.]
MINYLANPVRFLKFSKVATPVFGGLALITMIWGLYLALIKSPPAIEHGQSVRMMYVHVPAAWSAMMAYTALTVASAVSFIWRHPLADSAAKSFAVPGTAFTFLALVTGSLWGKPAWGTWWQWDGRMTSVLILLFIYMSYLALWQIIPERKRAARLAAILAMVGFVNIPIIKFSVDWWNTLHQPASISTPGAPGMPPEILWPLLMMVAAYSFLFAWLAMRGIEADIVKSRNSRSHQIPAAKVIIEDM